MSTKEQVKISNKTKALLKEEGLNFQVTNNGLSVQVYKYNKKLGRNEYVTTMKEYVKPGSSYFKDGNPYNCLASNLK